MQKMSEKEVLKLTNRLRYLANDTEVDMFCVASLNAYFEESANAIQALFEEIQQYRATGMTPEQIKEMQMDYCAKGAVLEEYKAIGTLDQCREAVERIKPKKPICKEMPYIEEVGFNDEYYCPTCNNYVGFFTEGMGEPEQMECCNVCGQHIAKDWSE